MMLSSQSYSRVDVQQLALLFAVLALGASHNLEFSPDDPIAEDYCEASRNCLVKGNFMTHSTLAGVQTLVRDHVITPVCWYWLKVSLSH